MSTSTANSKVPAAKRNQVLSTMVAVIAGGGNVFDACSEAKRVYPASDLPEKDETILVWGQKAVASVIKPVTLAERIDSISKQMDHIAAQNVRWMTAAQKDLQVLQDQQEALQAQLQQPVRKSSKQFLDEIGDRVLRDIKGDSPNAG